MSGHTNKVVSAVTEMKWKLLSLLPESMILSMTMHSNKSLPRKLKIKGDSTDFARQVHLSGHGENYLACEKAFMKLGEDMQILED